MSNLFSIEEECKKRVELGHDITIIDPRKPVLGAWESNKTKFWRLVEENQINGQRLGQILNTPIKQILFWDEADFPDKVIQDLQAFLAGSLQ